MPAAGDFNPTRFIAKFQRNTPLPPLFSRSCFDAHSLKPIRNLSHKRACVKAKPLADGQLTPGQQLAKRHLHIPREQAAPVKLAGEEVAHSGLEDRLHGN